MTTKTDNALDELKQTLATPDTLTLGDKTITIREITIGQLPAAIAYTAELFGDQHAKIEKTDFLLNLQPGHIAAMQGIVKLATDLTAAELELPLSQFVALFDAVMQKNDAFFLLSMTAELKKRAGQTCSTA